MQWPICCVFILHDFGVKAVMPKQCRTSQCGVFEGSGDIFFAVSFMSLFLSIFLPISCQEVWSVLSWFVSLFWLGGLSFGQLLYCLTFHHYTNVSFLNFCSTSSAIRQTLLWTTKRSPRLSLPSRHFVMITGSMLLVNVHLDTKFFVCVVAGGYVHGMLDLSIKYVEGMFFPFCSFSFHGTEGCYKWSAARSPTKDTFSGFNQTNLSYGYLSRTSGSC